MNASDALTDERRTVQKTWRLLPHDGPAIERLSRALRTAPLIAQLLINRKLTDPRQAHQFLKSPLADLHEPEALPGVPAAVERLWAAIQNQRRVCIYGDYDVDGVSGTAVLLGCLKRLGANVEFHVPHRLEHGYGLSGEALTKLGEAGAQTVVTVDCGICSCAEAEQARRLGLELIITDHHEPKAALPAADVLVHPRLPGAAPPYPCGHLAGAGVAFKLAWALCKRACGGAKVTPELREFLLDAIALAALGTVADVVPLFGENRVLVRHGLNRLRKQPMLGLKALLQSAKLDGKLNLDSGDIGYTLAPRINAAGRVHTATLAVELLTTSCAQDAQRIAEELEQHNAHRQTLERRLLQEARDLARQDPDSAAIVLAGSTWHPGLLGIVASRLVDQFARPVLMIALRDGQPHGQGSGRSVPGFMLHQALEECTASLVSHGGHAAAAGFRIVPEMIPAFRERFTAVADRHFNGTAPSRRLTIDAEIPLATLTSHVMLALDELAPYGCGNPPPVLLADRLQVVGQPKRVGNGERHLVFRVRQEGKEMKAVAFGMADRADELMSQQGKIAMVFTPRLNEWQGYRSTELEVKDFRAGDEVALEG
jgi:single-stranded-DNA-specific exonuclease